MRLALVILRRWWVIALLVALAAGSAYLLSRQQDPVYRATQLVLIQPSRSDFGLAEASRLLLEPAVIYLNSSLIAQRIIDDLSLDMLAQDLLSNVNIDADDLRYVIRIDVDLGDMEVAKTIAAAWGQELVDYRAQLNQTARQEDRVLAILPDVPTASQIAPTPLINAAAGALLGLILGILLVVGMEFLESSVIRRRDDLERSQNLNVLAAIPSHEGVE